MIDDFYRLNPYELNKEAKREMITKELLELTRFHRTNCAEYASFLDTIGFDEGKVTEPSDIPFFPVRMFKEHDLLSIDRADVFRTMTSSGTSGQKVSKIFLDKETALSQQKVMTMILSDFWGKKRLPLLVIDTPAVMKDRKMFSARGAAVIGLSVVARETTYVLNDDMSLNMKVLQEFLEKYNGQRFIIFGFTFMVWQHFYMQLLQMNKKIQLPEAFLMTGGGLEKA